MYDEIYQGEGDEEEEDGISRMSYYIDIPDEVTLLMAQKDVGLFYENPHVYEWEFKIWNSY